MGEPREIGDTQNLIIVVASDVGQNLPVLRIEKFDRPAAEYLEQLSNADHVSHPVQEGTGIAELLFDVDRFVSVNRIHDDRAVELGGIGARKTRITVRTPLHWSSDTVAVAEIDVVSHPDFIAIVNDRCTRK